MTTTSFDVTLPEWARQFGASCAESYPSTNERMKLVIELSRRNIVEKTGGPFGAAVFEKETGRLVAFGVNRVVSSPCSSAHAEIVALSLAQKKLMQWDLGAKLLPVHELVVNGVPCAMCFGAVLWSGVKSLVMGASTEEVERITGFDEGPLHPNWRGEAEKRGVKLTEGVLRDEACIVLGLYKNSGMPVYNAQGRK